MERGTLTQEIQTLTLDVRRLLESRQGQLDQYSERTLNSILRQLEKMESECRVGPLSHKEDRYRYIARLVVEADPRVMSADLGGRLIEVEQAYRDL
jgi:hypothetical protein